MDRSYFLKATYSPVIMIRWSCTRQWCFAAVFFLILHSQRYVQPCQQTHGRSSTHHDCTHDNDQSGGQDNLSGICRGKVKCIIGVISDPLLVLAAFIYSDFTKFFVVTKKYYCRVEQFHETFATKIISS